MLFFCCCLSVCGAFPISLTMYYLCFASGARKRAKRAKRAKRSRRMHILRDSRQACVLVYLCPFLFFASFFSVRDHAYVVLVICFHALLKFHFITRFPFLCQYRFIFNVIVHVFYGVLVILGESLKSQKKQEIAYLSGRMHENAMLLNRVFRKIVPIPCVLRGFFATPFLTFLVKNNVFS